MENNQDFYVTVDSCMSCSQERIVYVYEQPLLVYLDNEESHRSIVEMKFCSTCMPFDMLMEFIRTRGL